jgi:hypothetical protein
MATVHLIRDYAARKGKMYCGFMGVQSTMQGAEFITFILESGNSIETTTAMCEVTCERCQKAVRKLRKAMART